MNQASVATLDPAVDQRLVAAAQDQRLVSAVRGGDERAFEQLYERYRAPIRAFALRMTRDPDRADDLVQDIFMSALRRLRETDAPVAFRPWIYEIARNACIDEYRRRRRVPEVSIDCERTDGWLAHLAGGPVPEVAVQSKQQLEDLCGAFRGLSDRHHQIIVARELEGKSYRQIGDELNMSQAVVESTLFRARRRLSEEFQELSTGRRCERVQEIIAASGRRLGVRDRRAVAVHVEHCRPCRRQALAAGFSFERRPLPKVAAALFPLPLFGVLRRTAAGAHQRALASAAYTARLGQSLASLGPGRLAAAAAALAAGLGGGLLSQPAQAPARASSHQAPASAWTPARGVPLVRSANVRALPAAGSSRRNASPAGAGRTTRRSSKPRAHPAGAAGSRARVSSSISAPAAIPVLTATDRSTNSVARSTVRSVNGSVDTAAAAVSASVKATEARLSARGVVQSARGSGAATADSVPSLAQAKTQPLVQP